MFAAAAGLMQRSQELTSVKAELSKMSEDKENHILTELERLSAEQSQLTASHCDQLGQTLQSDIAQLTELTEQCQRDVIAQVNTATDHLLHEILGFIESMLVSPYTMT